MDKALKVLVGYSKKDLDEYDSERKQKGALNIEREHKRRIHTNYAHCQKITYMLYIYILFHRTNIKTMTQNSR